MAQYYPGLIELRFPGLAAVCDYYVEKGLLKLVYLAGLQLGVVNHNAEDYGPALSGGRQNVSAEGAASAYSACLEHTS